MAIRFRPIAEKSIEDAAAAVPGAFVIGLVGAAAEGATELLAAAEADPGDLILNQPFAGNDAIQRAVHIAELNRSRRHGAAILVYSHDEALLERICDEVWWIEGGRIAHRGAPRETLEHYRQHVAQRLRAELAVDEPISTLRRGDGRAELIAIETLAADDKPSALWISGEAAAIRVRVRFRAAVEDPVVGVLIRTRVGLDVFGTNTQLEGVHWGPVEAGAEREILFRFGCALCPQEYTITAASHDPDGVWHDWMEDAVAITVTDTRYTAGVANLRATVEVRT